MNAIARPLRRHDRAPFRGTVAICKDRIPRLVATENISSTGVLLRTDDGFADRSLVTLRVNLPGDKGFTVLGRVVHRGAANDVGIEFLDLMPRDRARIEGYVARVRQATSWALAR